MRRRGMPRLDFGDEHDPTSKTGLPTENEPPIGSEPHDIDKEPGEDEIQDLPPKKKLPLAGKVIKKRYGWFDKADGLSRADLDETQAIAEEKVGIVRRQQAAEKLIHKRFLNSMQVRDRILFKNKSIDEQEQLYKEWRDKQK